MKTLLMKIAVWGLNFIYLPFKLFPKQKKIVYISRQSNSVPLDFRLLFECIAEKNGLIKQVILPKKLGESIFEKISYMIHMFRQMYHIATSRVVVLDGYCIAGCILNHNKGTHVVQLWHALGAVKKFGYQILDMEEGSSSAVAETMKMHHNYELVFCASHATAGLFSDAFHTPIDRFRIMGMPRVDYILHYPDRNEEIYKDYPEFKDKKTILYVPTFRKQQPLDPQALIDAVDLQKYNLIIKAHPLDRNRINDSFLLDKKYGSYDLLKFADYIITDYSAIALEASILDKPVFFYVYDYDSYKEVRGLNIDPFQELPHASSKIAKGIIEIIDNGRYPNEELEHFKNKYVETLGFSNTEKIALTIIDLIQEAH